MRIEIVIYDGWDELDAIGPYEVFQNARAAVEDLSVALVTREPQTVVTASHGLRVLPDGLLSEDADVVVVPGGGWAAQNVVGTWGEVERGELPERLAELAEGRVMASVCTGGMLLSAAGVTRGRPATTHWVAYDRLAEEGADLRRERVVDDGDLVTSGGVTSGLDMALHLVEREWGAELANGIAKGMEIERSDAVWRRG